MEAREELVALAQKALPPQIGENIYRLDFLQLTALVLVLCTGKDDSEEDAPEKNDSGGGTSRGKKKKSPK